MVFVPGGRSIGVAPPVTLPDFWLDQLEVTNAAFKQFVDAGGYREAEYWTQPFRDGTRVLSFDEAMTRFRDATGRPGPRHGSSAAIPKGRPTFQWRYQLVRGVGVHGVRRQEPADAVSLVPRRRHR